MEKLERQTSQKMMEIRIDLSLGEFTETFRILPVLAGRDDGGWRLLWQLHETYIDLFASSLICA